MKKWLACLITAVFLALLAVIIRLGWKPLMGLLGAHGELIQSADSLLSILTALGSLAAAFFSFLSARRERHIPPPPVSEPTQRNSIKTGGGAYIGGNVNTGGGDFIGRNKTEK